jgi:oligopeptide transport system substrate-binding protein
MYTLVPNRYYYGRKPTISIELPGIKSADAAYRQYLAGRLDTTGIPLVFLNRWKGKSKEYHAYASSLITYLTPNTHVAPFNNVHCRLAAAYAIDRDTLANNIAQGTQRPTYAVVPKGMLGYYGGKNNPHYSPSKARSELALCPGRTVPFELAYPTFGETANQFVAVAGMMASVGMNVRLKPLPPDVWFTVLSESLDQTNTQIVWNGFQQDYPDPQDYCTVLLRSDQRYNIGGWHNPRYDQLVDRADVEFNRKIRAKLYMQAQHIALSQGAIVSLTNQVTQELIKPYVHGLVGMEAYAQLVPEDYKWANVSLSKH